MMVLRLYHISLLFLPNLPIILCSFKLMSSLVFSCDMQVLHTHIFPNTTYSVCECYFSVCFQG